MPDVRENDSSPYLLAADLDGTVIPLEDDKRHRRQVAEFAAAVQAPSNLILAFVTGRYLALACEGIEDFGLPEPDLLVCDVGTSLYRRSKAGYQVDKVYRGRMQEAIGGMTARRLRAALQDVPGLELQEEEKQGEFKISYFLPEGPQGDALVTTVRRRVEREGAAVSLVYSHDAVGRRGLLDLLPAGVGKDFAVRYLHDHTGVAEDRLVYAGDSGNDRAAMLSGYHVIVVGNAPDALKADLRREAALLGIADRLYFAREAYAAGVLEGLRHFGLL